MDYSTVKIGSVIIGYDEKKQEIKAVRVLQFSDGSMERKTFKGIIEVNKLLAIFAKQEGKTIADLCSDKDKVVINNFNLETVGVLVNTGVDTRRIAFDRKSGQFVAKSYRRSDSKKDDDPEKTTEPTKEGKDEPKDKDGKTGERVLKPIPELVNINSYTVALLLRKLNPDVDIRVGAYGIYENSKDTIFTSVPIDKLKLPDGMSFEGSELMMITKDGTTKKIKVLELSKQTEEFINKNLLPKDVDLSDNDAVLKAIAELYKTAYSTKEPEKKKGFFRRTKEKVTDTKAKAEEVTKRVKEKTEKVSKKVEEKTGKTVLRFLKRSIYWLTGLTIAGLGLNAVVQYLKNNSDSEESSKSGTYAVEMNYNGVDYAPSYYVDGYEVIDPSELGGVVAEDEDGYDDTYTYGTVYDTGSVSDSYGTVYDMGEYIPPSEMGGVIDVSEDKYGTGSSYDSYGTIYDTGSVVDYDEDTSLGNIDTTDSIEAQVDTIDKYTLFYKQPFPFQDMVVPDDYTAINTINQMRDRYLNKQISQEEFMNNLVNYTKGDSTFFDGQFVEQFKHLHPLGKIIVVRIAEGALQDDINYTLYSANGSVQENYDSLQPYFEQRGDEIYVYMMDKGRRI